VLRVHQIPRKFFLDCFEKWKSNGYSIIDFAESKVDLTSMPDYYQRNFKNIERNIEKNYFLNHLLYYRLAQVEHVNNTYYFRPDFVCDILPHMEAVHLQV
tara:strand:- start:910 stop:1209 length:300 start_codon:yes stop_codon:yes gene_type:complete